jgi:hypothetical protein
MSKFSRQQGQIPVRCTDVSCLEHHTCAHCLKRIRTLIHDTHTRARLLLQARNSLYLTLTPRTITDQPYSLAITFLSHATVFLSQAIWSRRCSALFLMCHSVFHRTFFVLSHIFLLRASYSVTHATASHIAHRAHTLRHTHRPAFLANTQMGDAHIIYTTGCCSFCLKHFGRGLWL